MIPLEDIYSRLDHTHWVSRKAPGEESGLELTLAVCHPMEGRARISQTAMVLGAT